MQPCATTILSIPQRSGFLATLAGVSNLMLVTSTVVWAAGFFSCFKMLRNSFVYICTIAPEFVWPIKVHSATSLLLVVSIMALINPVCFVLLTITDGGYYLRDGYDLVRRLFS